MANITEVDYVALATIAGTIKENGDLFQSEMSTIYSKMESLKTCWKGVRVDRLINQISAEDFLATVNAMINLVTFDLPTAVAKAADNYKMADTGEKAATIEYAAGASMVAIVADASPTLTYFTDQVLEIKTAIDKAFKKAVGYLDIINNAYSSRTWISDAATTFDSKFNSLYSILSANISSFQTNFATEMTNTEADMSGAETNNTQEGAE